MAGVEEHEDSDARGPSILSARAEPRWVNPATIKGILALAAGMSLLYAPRVSGDVLQVLVAVGLVVAGASDLRFKLRSRGPARIRGAVESLLTMGAGIALLVWPDLSTRLIGVGVALYLIARGIAIISGSLGQRRRDQRWALDLSRGVLLVALGLLTMLIPESLIAGLLAGLAAAALVVGAILLAYGLRAHTNTELVDLDAASVSQIMIDWIRDRDVGDERRGEIGEGLFFEAPNHVAKLVSWWVMLLLSVAIATFGIMQDSTAVVIGAMLIAPLMTPMLGAAAAIVNSWRVRIVNSLLLVTAGVIAAVSLAVIIGQWLPTIVPLEGNSQVTSRISPNLIDMLIALAAGAAGAYANVDRRVSSSIAGVAIAVALVPPLGVVGLTLQAGLYQESRGAFLLFLTNFVSIILAATLVFFLTGYANLARLREHREYVAAVLSSVLLAGLIIMVPLVFTSEGVLATAKRQSDAQAAVDAWVGEDSGLTVSRVSVDGVLVEVLLSGAGEVPPLVELEQVISQDFGRPATLRVAYVPALVQTYSQQEGLSSDAGTLEE